MSGSLAVGVHSQNTVKRPAWKMEGNTATEMQASKAPPIDKISESEGLSRAYKDGDTHVRGKTMYVAGTNAWKYVYDDITKVPFWGDARESTRYKAAEETFKRLMTFPGVQGIIVMNRYIFVFFFLYKFRINFHHHLIK